MPAPLTYRLRLIVYVTILLVFLISVLAFAYGSSRAMLLQEAKRNADRLAQQIAGQLQREAHDLSVYARMVRDNVQLSEYMFIVTSIGADPAALRDLYQRQFGWLPVHRAVLLSRTGQVLIGRGHDELVSQLTEYAGKRARAEQSFFYFGATGLELVSMAPVTYRGRYLGIAALARLIGMEWMAVAAQTSKGQLLMVKDGKIILTTLTERIIGADFHVQSGLLHVGGSDYLARRIALSAADAGLPDLWFALSEDELMRRLNQQRDFIALLTTVGCIGTLLMAFMLLRNFSAPLGRLVTMIQEVGEGRFPVFDETRGRDEVSYLWNQFSTMVRSLRDKQEEINKAHALLEHQTITDAMTGLYNRRYLYELFPKFHADAQREGQNLTVILTDIDRFKDINDRHGHPVGDEALIHFSRILKDCSRISDFVFRTGGEEFLILVKGDISGGMTLAEKIRSALESTPLISGNLKIGMTASFGVAQVESVDKDKDCKSVLYSVSARADKRLYAAKWSGRNCVVGDASGSICA